MAEDLQLNEFIKSLRSELQSAAIDGEDSAIRFIPKSVKIELTLEASKSGKGGVNFKIFSVGAEAGGEISTANTQKLTLELVPVDENGEQTFIMNKGGKSG